MRILVTNDDGVDAPGIDVLRKIAAGLSDDVWVVAPDSDCSGAGHSITLKNPLRARKVSDRVYAVRGTPTDCVILGVREILRDKRPDLVLSGVNRGQNIAHDVTYSGTVACAMEASLLGIRAIALSLAADTIGPGDFKWDTALHHGAPLVKELVEKEWPTDVLVNVNFPDRDVDDVLGVKVTRQGLRHRDQWDIDARADGNGFPYYWMRYRLQETEPLEGSDSWAVANGYISVTPLSLDLTNGHWHDNFALELDKDVQANMRRVV